MIRSSVEYDSGWPDEFARLRDRAQAPLGDIALSIEHVGSTAVSGMAAKPVIDLVVVIEGDDALPQAIRRLEVIGYRARGELGVPGREALSWPESEKRRHLYVSPTTTSEVQGSPARADPLLAAE